MRRSLNVLLLLPVERPGATLLAAGLLTALAIAGAARLQMHAALDAMFPRQDPAAQAMEGVLDHFQTADELLVLVTLPDDVTPPDPARLTDYAQRLASVVAKSSAAPLVDAVVYRSQPDAQQFIEHELVPAGMLYLDDAQFAAVQQRLSPAGMRAQLAHDQAMMLQPGPAAQAITKAMMQDPLSLRDFMVARLASSRPMKTYQNSDALISPDGRALLIRVLAKRPPTDLEYATALSGAIHEATVQASPAGLRVSLAGAYPIAALSARSIRHDAINSVISSVVLLLALFVMVYRRPLRMFHLAFIPVAVGTLWGFGAYGLTLRNLSPVAAVIGGVLAGMGIDYSVLYLTCYETVRAGGAGAKDAAWRTINQISTAVLAAFVTSVAGFLAIGCSSVQAMRDFAALGTLGLTGSFLAALFILPAMLVLIDRRKLRAGPSAFRFRMIWLVRWVGRHRTGLPVAFGVLGIACIVVAATGPGIFRPDADLTVMHPRPNAALEAQAEIGRRFGISAGTMLVDLHADNDSQLVTLAQEVQRRLSSPEVKAAGIAGTYGLATWLPDPSVASARRQALAPWDADKVAADFTTAVNNSPFDMKAFEGYRSFLRQLLQPATVPDMQTLQKYPGLARQMLPPDGSCASPEAVTVLFLTGSEERRADRDRAIDAVQNALHGLDGATLTGLPVVGHDADMAVWVELPRLMSVAIALVAGYLLLHFRNRRQMLLSLLPAAFGLAALAGVARWMGIGLNMINLVALPLLIGIDVDYGIYLVSLARRAASPDQTRSAVASGVHAVVVCATSMIAGYASLMLTSVPAVQSLGLFVAIGVASCVAGTLFILCPLLLPKPADSARLASGRN